MLKFFIIIGRATTLNMFKKKFCSAHSKHFIPYSNIPCLSWKWYDTHRYTLWSNERLFTFKYVVDCAWNAMAHAQKPDSVFRRNRPSPFKSAGASVQSTTGSLGVRISGSNAGYTMFRGSVKSTGCPLHSPVSPSLPLPFVTVCHHIWTGLYFLILRQGKYTLIKYRSN